MLLSSTDSDSHHAISDFKVLKDELRLQLHLAGMEARKHWEKAQTIERLRAAERLGHAVSLASHHALHEALVELAEFRAALTAQPPVHTQ